jgi:thioredoxin-like negative regulator of GroEL
MLTLAFLQSAAEEHAHNTAAYSVDVEKYPTAKEYFKVTVVPTVVVYKDGKEIKKVEGMDGEKAKEVAAVLV